MRYHRLAMIIATSCVVAILGCVAPPDETPTGSVPVPAEKKPDQKPAEIKKLSLWKNITVEIQGDKRRVRINSEVCLREGLLEQLLTKKGMKEHEAILSADIDARHLHAALTLAGAEP